MITKTRISSLDSLRGIAALAVVFYHYTFRYDQLYGHEISLENFSIFKYGYLGVQLFFLISGFVIYLSLEKTNNLKQFAVSRFTRLYPVYWVAVVLTFTVVLIFGLDGREVSYFTMLINLTMFQGFIGITSVDGVYWSLFAELRFYFIIAALYFILPKRSFLVSFLSLITITLLFKYLQLIDSANSVIKLINFGLSSNYLHYFGAGIGFYLILNKKNLIIALLYILISLLHNFIFISGIELLIITSFYIIFILLINGKLGLLNKHIFIYFGSISYSLYLVHQNIGYIIINYCYEYNISPYISIALALAVTIFISNYFAKFFERTLSKKIKERLKNHVK